MASFNSLFVWGQISVQNLWGRGAPTEVEMTQSDGKQNEVPESDKMLAEIEQAQQALKSKAESTSVQEVPTAQNTPEKATPEKAPEPTAKQEAAPQGQAASQQEAPVDKKTDKANEDAREWAQRKGLKDADAAFRSLRELEQKFGKTQAELKELKSRETMGQPPQAPYFQPTPQFQPQPAYPSYPPYQAPMDRSQIVAQEARRYNMDPEDFERVLALSNDMAAVHARRLQAQFDSRLEEINKETRRNSELRELMNDPYFTNPKVQFEMHKVLEENPKAFALEPSPYLYAFNEAQRRLGRQSLQETPVDSDKRSALPTTPPVDSGKASSPGFDESQESKLMKEFNDAKTADEQKRILSRLGAVQTI